MYSESMLLIDYSTVMMVSVICIIVFLVLLPGLNILIPYLLPIKKDEMVNDNVVLDTLNEEVLRQVKVEENKVILVRRGDVKVIFVDIAYFNGKKAKVVSYKVVFNGDVAHIEAPIHFDGISIKVVKADKYRIHKKTMRYPNNILNIIASVGVAVGLIVPSIFWAVYYSAFLNDFYIEYVQFYIIPIVIGLLIGVAHYFAVRLLTNSFNYGGKR